MKRLHDRQSEQSKELNRRINEAHRRAQTGRPKNPKAKARCAVSTGSAPSLKVTLEWNGETFVWLAVDESVRFLVQANTAEELQQRCRDALIWHRIICREHGEKTFFEQNTESETRRAFPEQHDKR
jgi:hypothetical protein